MSAALYDGDTLKRLNADGAPWVDGVGGRPLDVFCMSARIKDGWAGPYSLLLDLDRDETAVASDDEDECALRLANGGTVAVIGWTPEGVAAAGERLKQAARVERMNDGMPAWPESGE